MRDITFPTADGCFNYRVCGVLLSGGKILAMRDEHSPYYYLPGGRVHVGETAEAAILRELQEELQITPRIVRPLWLNQAFFTEDATRTNYHELCLYFLIDGSGSGLPAAGTFTRREGIHGAVLTFEWLELASLKDAYFYPAFLKEAVFHLPDCLTLRTEQE